MKYFLSLLGITSVLSIGHASGVDSLTATGAECACNELSTLFPSQFISPGESNYTTQATYYWDVRASLEPACIFLPETDDQVATAVETFVQCDAQFAIRGGGHMNFSGSNNIDGGVLLAFNNMANYKVNEDTIEVEPGMTWYDVYAALDPYGRVAIGGRMKTIGVPGLTLIGGVSYFMNKYGFAMDNVASYDVVLGNGTQVVANSTSNPDLFWALKGGANNFGIITKFTLKTYSMPHISTTAQVFDDSSAYSFTKAVADWASGNSDSPVAAGSIITTGYNVTTKALQPTILGVQAGISDPPSEFANFTTIPGVSKTNNVTTSGQWASTLDSPQQMFRYFFSSHQTRTRVL